MEGDLPLFSSEVSGGSHYQLFNLAEDPYEANDLAAARPAELRRMMQALVAQLERHRALYPVEAGKTVAPRVP